MLHKTGRKFITVLISLAMVLSLLPAVMITASAADAVIYSDPDGNNTGANAVKVLSDGKYLTAGSRCDPTYTFSDITVVRYNPNGTIDSTFGTDGMAVVDAGTPCDSGIEIVVQPDGRIVVASGTKATDNSGNGYTMIRLTADGALDPTFGINGIVSTDIGALLGAFTWPEISCITAPAHM
jgi:uncharacterized delta-60 repeat protein